MIEFLCGVLKEIDESGGVIEIGGVGIRVEMTLKDLSELPSLESPLKLYARSMVRDDSILLYGFTTKERRWLFNLLISVPTVGPSLAASLISSMEYEDIAGAIIIEDHERLSAVPGIGKKTAQKIIIELRDKLQKKMEGGYPPGVVPDEERKIRRDVLDALVSLGFSKQDSIRTYSEVYQNLGKGGVSEDTIIRLCLKKIGEKGGKRG